MTRFANQMNARWRFTWKKEAGMDFVVSGYSEHQLDQIRSLIDAIKDKWQGETDQRIVMMALTRMYDSVVQPPIAEDYPTEEELREMGALPITKEEQIEGFRKFALLMEARLRELEERKQRDAAPQAAI